MSGHTRPCQFGGLGVDVSGSDRAVAARCECGAAVTVVDGRIPFHHEYPPTWADGPSDEMCGCGARAVEVEDAMSHRGRVLACSVSGFGCAKCPNAPEAGQS